MAGVKGQWNECKCQICKKRFIPTAAWVYKRNDSYFCSWTCFRKEEKKREATRKRKPMIAPTR